MLKKSVREQLFEILSQNPIDIDRFLDLSQQLSDEDPDFVRFSVDAALIDRLGRELVGRQETAVAELIKNAYDADARNVRLHFRNVTKSGGILTITDDGLGMTREELVHGFMRLSSDEKVRQPYSPKFERRRAGRKGIGRLAVQRLGTRLKLTTRAEGSASTFQIEIDWSRFNRGKELGSIASVIKEIANEGPVGTTLVISDLREAWNDAALKRIYRDLADIIQPFSLSSQRRHSLDPPSDETEIEDLDLFFDDDNEAFTVVDDDDEVLQEGDGFAVRIQKDDAKSQKVFDETTEILNHALAVIRGFVDEEGHGFWSIYSKKLNFAEMLPMGLSRDKPKTPYLALRNIDFKAYYFIYGVGLIPRSVNALVEELSEYRAGIRIFRNGYRARPYGEPGDDWLGLAKSSRARAILPPHGNENFFGFVEINDLEGTRFEETSSRENLLENAAFGELRDFVARALKAGALKIADQRGRKKTASQKDWQPRVKPSEDLDQLAKELEDTANELENQLNSPPSSDGAGDSQLGEEENSPNRPDSAAKSAALRATGAMKEAAKSITFTARKQAEMETASLEEVGMLRVLASLGLIIAEFTHEIRQSLGAAQGGTQLLTDVLTTDSSLGPVIRDLNANIERIRSYAAYFDKAIAENNQLQLQTQDLRKIVREFIAAVKPAADRTKIDIVAPEFKGYEFLTCPMHASEYASILFNFYSNSVKAIARGSNPGRIWIRAGRTARVALTSASEVEVFADDKQSDGIIWLEFLDNGDGISPEIEDQVFNSFFTTAIPAGAHASADEEITGTGLGLKIVADIVQSYGGKVFLGSAPGDYSTCFRIELPESNAEQKRAYREKNGQ